MRKLQNKTNVTAPTGTYPFGKIKDNPGDNTGTPVNEQVYGDMHQFFEKLLSEAGITANDLPENATNGFQTVTAILTLIQTYITALKDGVPAAGDTLNKLYTLITAMGRPRGGWDASSNTVPSSDIQEGDFWRITVQGTLSSLTSGAGVVRPGDLLIAIADGVTTQANFYCIQSNVDQATTSVLGLVKLYTSLAASNADGSVDQATLKAAFDALAVSQVLTSTLEVQGGIRTANTGVYLKEKIIDIGDWNIVSSITKAVAHGLTLSKIRHVSFMIRSDDGSIQLEDNSLYAAQNTPRMTGIDATNVNLSGTTNLQTTDWDDTSYNRGWVYIKYEA